MKKRVSDKWRVTSGWMTVGVKDGRTTESRGSRVTGEDRVTGGWKSDCWSDWCVIRRVTDAAPTGE